MYHEHLVHFVFGFTRVRKQKVVGDGSGHLCGRAITQSSQKPAQEERECRVNMREMENGDMHTIHLGTSSASCTDSESDSGFLSSNACAEAERQAEEDYFRRRVGLPARPVYGRGKGKGASVRQFYEIEDDTDDEESDRDSVRAISIYGTSRYMGSIHGGTTSRVHNGGPKFKDLISSFENHIAYHTWNGKEVKYWFKVLFLDV